MIKLTVGLVLSILLFIFVVQNLQMVELHFLFWQFNGSLALILALTFIVTLIISLLVALPYSIKKKRAKSGESKIQVIEAEKPKN